MKNSLIILLVLVFMSCAARRQRQSVTNGTDGLYDSEFPQKAVSTYLKKMSSTIRLISSLTFYHEYYFPSDEKMTLTKLKKNPALLKQAASAIIKKPASGTGTIVALRDGPPHFELVGIANALPILQHLVVRPDPGTEITPAMFGQPYLGSVFIERQNVIIQGMTFAISAENIRFFFKKKSKRFGSYGFKTE